jgi:hypothetical protein
MQSVAFFHFLFYLSSAYLERLPLKQDIPGGRGSKHCLFFGCGMPFETASIL